MNDNLTSDRPLNDKTQNNNFPTDKPPAGRPPHARRPVNYFSLTLALVVLMLMVVVLFRARSKNFYHANRETEISTITVQDISAVSELKIMTIYKEILVGCRKQGDLMGLTEYKIYAIYPAKLQLGFDLSRCKNDWLVQHGDSTFVTLPPIEILNKDNNYVDEANRRVPIQTGKWNGQEMNSLRDEANRRMINQCTNEGCWEQATKLGKEVIADLLETLGCRNVVVTTEPLPLPSQRN